MDFEVTALRKRPKSLAELVGQDFVVSTLGQALEKNQIAPAYLFSGPRGTGKTSAARIMARSLNCSQGPTINPCGNCSSCLEISKGSSSDVIEIDGASNTGVNDVREIKNEILYAPQGSYKKIYIIDEVHMLSNNAFNALLKTIEEPPPYIVFLFATTEIHKIPATIRSRCQQFRFRLFPPELIKNKLLESCGEINRDLAPDALLWIAREADGSLRDAYTLFDQILSFSDEKITLEIIQKKMGLLGYDRLVTLLEEAALGEREAVLQNLDALLSAGISVEQILIEITGLLRGLTLLAYGIQTENLLGLSPEKFPKAAQKNWNDKQLEEATEEGLSLYRDIRYSLNPRYELELFLGRLCSLRHRLGPQEVLQHIGQLREELLTGEWVSSDPPPLENRTPDPEEKESQKIDSSTEGKAEQFFSTFKKNKPSPSSSIPFPEPRRETQKTDKATQIPHDNKIKQEELVSSASKEPQISPSLDPKEYRRIILENARKEDFPLAVALEKAQDWEWGDKKLTLIFENSFSASTVKNKSDVLENLVNKLGIPDFVVEIQTQSAKAEEEKKEDNPRAALVCQVFQGQILRGTI